MLYIPIHLLSFEFLFCVLTCITCTNYNLRLSLNVLRLKMNFEHNSQIVTLSETYVNATFTFTSTFKIYHTIVKQSPVYYNYVVLSRARQ